MDEIGGVSGVDRLPVVGIGEKEEKDGGDDGEEEEGDGEEVGCCLRVRMGF